MGVFAISKRLLRFWAIERDKPELLKAQYKAFASKIPMMYMILIVNSWALALTHIHSAPHWLSIYYPSALTLFCAIRFAVWLKSKNIDPDAEQAWRALRRTNRLVMPIALSFSIWSILLFPYGDEYAQAHVAFYMGITVISCIFCLMYLRSAALTCALIVNSIFTVFFLSSDIPTFIAAALNVVLVTAAMLVIVASHYRDFTLLIEAQVKTAALSNENSQLANLDALTQIPNRRKFFAMLDAVCDDARTRGTRFSVAIMDIDGFKSINDLYGHAHGDRLLSAVGQRLLNICDENTHLARLGGDEFALIINRNMSDQEIRAFGDQVCLALRPPFVLYNTIVKVAASLGVATFPDMAADAYTLYEHADYALYHGKRNNRGTVTLFSSADKEQIQRNANIEQALRLADFESELSVCFQPVVSIDNSSTVAFEALARWKSPMMGPISPAEFIPAAERMGIIGQLSEILFAKALRVASGWPADISLSFNLSANDLNDTDGLDRIINTIHETDFPPHRVDFEITETATLYDLQKTEHAIQSLRQLGCGVTLDDFGTGYSSLSQLHALPLTRIKIDKSFVTEIHDNPVSYKIVKSLLALSRDMDLACVVEGVETERELAVLKELGASFVQGYLFAAPLTEAEALAWIATGRTAITH
ncbi:EAL domain-containing protein [Herbaspirillum sp.]|uniref:putative bifunctional diguanylate cyclase/phosphodiesterase n=1 Tax=Herbaspirillum sp. TaxID=1890675 RepID=UPI0031E3564C